MTTCFIYIIYIHIFLFAWTPKNLPDVLGWTPSHSVGVYRFGLPNEKKCSERSKPHKLAPHPHAWETDPRRTKANTHIHTLRPPRPDRGQGFLTAPHCRNPRKPLRLVCLPCFSKGSPPNLSGGGGEKGTQNKPQNEHLHLHSSPAPLSNLGSKGRDPLLAGEQVSPEPLLAPSVSFGVYFRFLFLCVFLCVCVCVCVLHLFRDLQLPPSPGELFFPVYAGTWVLGSIVRRPAMKRLVSGKNKTT